jgi:hypothetical protein
MAQTLTVSLAYTALKLDQPGVGALTYSDEERKVLSCRQARLVVYQSHVAAVCEACLRSLTCHLRALLACCAQMLAKDSLRWKCPVCAAAMAGILPDAPRGSGSGSGSGAEAAPADRCLPATPPAPERAEAAPATATAALAAPTAADPPAPAVPSPAAIASTPAPAPAAAVPAAAARVATAATSTSQPAPSAAPAPSATATAPAPAAPAAPVHAVAPQADWSLYVRYGLECAIVAWLLNKLYH